MTRWILQFRQTFDYILVPRLLPNTRDDFLTVPSSTKSLLCVRASHVLCRFLVNRGVRTINVRQTVIEMNGSYIIGYIFPTFLHKYITNGERVPIITTTPGNTKCDLNK